MGIVKSSEPLKLETEASFKTKDGEIHKIEAYKIEGIEETKQVAVDITTVEKRLKMSYPKFYSTQDEEGEEIPPKYIKNGDLLEDRVYLVEGKPPLEKMKKDEGNRTGLCYDECMFLHDDPEGHPENPTRLKQIEAYLKEASLFSECTHVKCRPATHEEIGLCHGEVYIKRMSEGEEPGTADYYIVDDTYKAAIHSCGSVLKLVDEIYEGRLDNGFALCRPPGHHSNKDIPMGFCFFSNVCIAAKYALKKYPDQVKKVLILDWDVHHGNGTQDLRIDREDILFISLHKDIYPGTGSIRNVGKIGNTVNICFRTSYGDNDILEAFNQVVVPIAEKFDADLVIVSAGFDAVLLDPLGGCNLSHEVFSHLSDFAMKFSKNKKNVVMALEGGYEPYQLKKSVFNCVRVMRGYSELPELVLDTPDVESLKMIKQVRKIQQKWWDCVKIEEEEEEEKEEDTPKNEDTDDEKEEEEKEEDQEEEKGD